jgi:NAD(P)-dependent dehydrogenase (short-subunit alcohol dehydrogenase family)
MFRLDGKTAFVYGSRGHLGQAITLALARAGAHVLLNGRDAAALDRFAAISDPGFLGGSRVLRRHDIPRSAPSSVG